MRHKGAAATFFLALSAFLAVGAGALLLLKPGGSAAHAHAPPVSTPVPGQDTATPAASAQPEEFALVAGAGAIPHPGLPNRVVIPSIALDAKVVEVGIVVEGGRPVWDTASFAVGYHRGTALPGERGNTVLAGHISSPVSKKGDIFKRLPEVRIGDRVDVYVGERRVSYEVSEIKLVAPTAVEVLDPTPDATLTMITCYPDRVYSKRLVVVGKLVSAG